MEFTRAFARTALVSAAVLCIAASATAQQKPMNPVKPLKPAPVRPELRKLNLKPDLVIRKLRLKSYGPCKPRRAVLTFEAVIANMGNAPVPRIGGALIKVAEKNGAGPWAGSARLDRPIPPGGNVPLTVPVYYLQSNPGHMVRGAPHRFRAEVDPLKRIAEKNEANNLSATVRVGAPPDCPSKDKPRLAVRPEAGKALRQGRGLRRLPGAQRQLKLTRPDLVVGAVSAPQSCEPDRVGLRIYNIGNEGVPESAYDATRGAAIQIRLDGRPWGSLRLREADSEKLLRRPRSRANGHEVRLPARKLEIGTHRVTVTVDSNNAVAELNEGNNTSGERIYCRIEADPDASLSQEEDEDGLPQFPGPKR